jgi:hypothetical protein
VENRWAKGDAVPITNLPGDSTWIGCLDYRDRTEGELPELIDPAKALMHEQTAKT